MTLVVLPPPFDYGALDADTAAFVDAAAARVEGRERDVLTAGLAAVLEQGADLAAVRGRVRDAPGGFDGWLAYRKPCSRASAYNYISVHERFGDCPTVGQLPISPVALYRLSSPRVDDDARRAALARATAGEAITPAVAREIVLAHTPAAPAPRRARSRDAVGLRVPDHLRRAFDHAHEVADLVRALGAVREGALALLARPGAECLAAEWARVEGGLSAGGRLAALADRAAGSEPHCSRCVVCLEGQKLRGDAYPNRECQWCHGREWLSRRAWQALGGDAGGITAHYRALWKKDGELQ